MAASAGVIITAALESVGYEAQSQVLEHLGGFFQSFAFLIFLFVGMTALIYYAIGERPYKAGWILIGPVIFLSMLHVRTVSTGSEWQFGDFKGDSVAVEAVIGSPVNAKVSWFFDLYNRMVSQIVQAAVTVFSDDMHKMQVRFMNRERIMSQLFASEVFNPGLSALIRQGLVGQCGEWLDASRRVSLGNRDRVYRGSAEYLTALKTYHNPAHMSEGISAGSPAYVYVTELFPASQNLRLVSADGTEKPATAAQFVDTFCDGSADIKADFAKSPQVVLSQPLSCEKIWCWTVMGLHQESKWMMKQATEDAINSVPAAESLTSDERAAIANEMLAEIALKLQPAPPLAPTMPGTPQLPVKDISIIPTVIAGNLLRKEMAKTPHSSHLNDVASRAGIYTRQFNYSGTQSEAAKARVMERVQQTQLSTSLQYENFTFAMLLPYLQGVLLYVMALAFPFYCFLLLIPSHASSFFGWMRMWAWLKSWDVGWALTMIVEDLLWDLMPHSSEYSVLEDPKHTPISIFEAAFHNDPSYSLTMYYLLVSAMLIGVPMLTGKLLVGREATLYMLLFSGLKRFSSDMGHAGADMKAMHQTFEAEWLRTWGDIEAVNANLRDYAEGRIDIPELRQMHATTANRTLFANEMKMLAAGTGAAGLLLGGPVGAGIAFGSTAVMAHRRNSQRIANSTNQQVNELGSGYALFNSNMNETRRAANELRAAVSGRVMTSYLNDVPDVAATFYGVPNAVRGQVAYQNGKLLGEGARFVILPQGAAIALADNAVTMATEK